MLLKIVLWTVVIVLGALYWARRSSNRRAQRH